jgi:hypothetical protein
MLRGKKYVFIYLFYFTSEGMMICVFQFINQRYATVLAFGGSYALVEAGREDIPTN